MSRLIPTEIRPESLQEFKQLFLSKYDYHLSDEQATEQGLKLLRLVMALIENLDIGLDNANTDMVD